MRLEVEVEVVWGRCSFRVAGRDSSGATELARLICVFRSLARLASFRQMNFCPRRREERQKMDLMCKQRQWRCDNANVVCLVGPARNNRMFQFRAAFTESTRTGMLLLLLS